MPDERGSVERRFGTMGGVFTPCTLTILGVILFLRSGQVVGNAGVLHAVLILVAAKAITTLTAFSLSAIATNTRVRGGGAYYLISRSLGVDYGGAIGLLFFLAQAVAVSMYVIGFAEAVLGAFPGLHLSLPVIASIVNVLVFASVYIGAGWTIRVQYGILAVLGLAIVSFLAGALPGATVDRLRENLDPGYPPGENIFTMFALFFPAVTGIMAGANMSGDLKDPGRSIPRGTLAAIGVTAVVYLVVILALGAGVERAALLENSLVLKDVALVPLLITLGVFAATLSSALGSMMGAPRILQALARDDIFRGFGPFRAGSPGTGEPRRAIVVTFLISQTAVLLADLDTIAPIITMFFLITYGYLNLATFTESLAGNPSYRPRFRYCHWTTALLGALGCFAVMLLLSPLWAITAIAILAALQWRIRRREVRATWGDVQSGSAFERARRNLLRLEEERYHPKNWRPSILALSGRAWDRVHLPVFGHWLTGGRGLLTVGQVIVGDTEQHLERREGQEKVLRSFIREQNLDAFPAVLVAPSLSLGIEALVQCSGVGALRPNLVLTGWFSDDAREDEFAGLLRTVAALRRSIVMVRLREPAEDPWLVAPGTVDVWWRGKANGQLMLLLAHLLTQSAAWRHRRIRLLRMIPSPAGQEEATRHLRELIESARIDAHPEVIVGERPTDAILRTSAGAAAVFLGFVPPEAEAVEGFVDSMNRLMADLPTVLVVWSAGDASLEA